jgi:hypothetical protein
LELAKICPIKVRETAGIYRTGLTKDGPKSARAAESLHAGRSSPQDMKGDRMVLERVSERENTPSYTFLLLKDTVNALNRLINP